MSEEAERGGYSSEPLSGGGAGDVLAGERGLAHAQHRSLAPEHERDGRARLSGALGLETRDNTHLTEKKKALSCAQKRQTHTQRRPLRLEDQERKGRVARAKGGKK